MKKKQLKATFHSKIKFCRQNRKLFDAKKSRRMETEVRSQNMFPKVILHSKSLRVLLHLRRKNMAHQWLPNINEFFFSLGRLIDTCDSQLHSVSRDRSEFLTRRLDEYARTMSIIVTRFNESYGHLESQRSCLHNLSYILERTLSLRSHFERECLLQDESDENGVLSLISVENSGVRGRPRFCLSQEQLQALHRDCGMRWSDISRTLGVSERTVRRRRHQFGMSVEGREFSNMSDYQLDEFVGRILQATPAVGLRMVMGSLRHHGHTVQRHRVLHSIRRVDPVTSTLRNSRRVIRRSYNVACPNALWYVDFIILDAFISVSSLKT